MSSLAKKSRSRPLYTIGHSTRSARELVEILEAFGVVHLIDIRGIPRSRTNPQFDLERLPATLRSAGIGYTHLEALGGRRGKSKLVAPSVNAGWQLPAFHNYADYARTAAFAQGLGTLLQLAAEETCAIMCAETLWWRCHRRIVTDHALARGVPVIHLFNATKSEPASLTPFAEVSAEGDVSYPAPSRSRRGPAAQPSRATARAAKRDAVPRKGHGPESEDA